MPDHDLAQIWCARVECQKKISNKRKTCKNGIFVWAGRDEALHMAMPLPFSESRLEAFFLKKRCLFGKKVSFLMIDVGWIS